MAKSEHTRLPIIGVIGGNECSNREFDLALEVGALIARSNAILICGGMGGIMEAACKGAVESGGTTVGILPGTSVEEANKYVKIPVATGMGIGRNIIIVRTAQAIIAIDGRYGTLSEIAFALQLNKPVIGLKTWLKVPEVISAKSAQEAANIALSHV